MLQPHEIFPGAILEYNINFGLRGEQFNWQPKSINWEAIRDLTDFPAMCKSAYRPIPLTEKIVVEWCGFEKMFSSAIHTLCELTIDKNTSFYFYNWHKEDRQYLSYKGLQIEVLTLHHLQLLVFALTQQPLKITLP
jgi:hypothetical protein